MDYRRKFWKSVESQGSIVRSHLTLQITFYSKLTRGLERIHATLLVKLCNLLNGNYDFRAVLSCIIDESFLVCMRDMIFAGADTTNSVMEHGILHVSLRPEVQRRVQAEIDEVVGHNRPPTYEDKGKYVGNRFSFC